MAPISINLLLTSIGRNDPAHISYGYVGLMFVGLIAGSVCESQYWQRSMRAGFRLRAALIAAVYRCVPELLRTCCCDWCYARQLPVSQCACSEHAVFARDARYDACALANT